MARKTLILGGYGNFGKRISEQLARANVPLIIAGRNLGKAKGLAAELKMTCSASLIETALVDVQTNLNESLEKLKPFIVINTCGPFQLMDYRVAEACIKRCIHYIDLADGRTFVNDIVKLDKDARDNECLVVSGASSVPGLSSAVLEYYKSQFSSIKSLKYGITPGQKSERGLATTQSILSYLGKSLYKFASIGKNQYGWQSLYKQRYPILGKRWMANCDIPDLDLLPKYYGVESISFSAGMESKCLHMGMWLASWLVRLGLPLNLQKHSKQLLKFSHYFDKFGSADGGMHMIIKGLDHNTQIKTIRWFIIAKDNHGPYIPTVPAVVLTKRLLNDGINETGATPCVSLVSLEEYLNELQNLNITVYEELS